MWTNSVVSTIWEILFYDANACLQKEGSDMPFWRLYYHIVWSTQNRYPLITLEIEESVHEAITYSANRNGVTVHAIGGTDDHVHLAIEAPPTITLSETIGKIKGISSYTINHDLGDELEFTFRWQRAYGIVSFADAQLASVCRYVTSQRERHENGSIRSTLEQITRP